MTFYTLTSNLPGEPSYRLFPLKDRNPLGGTTKRRMIEAPNDAMRVLQTRLVAYLRAIPLALPHATGCRLGDNPLRNVQHHRRNRYFYLVDLHSAYRHVDAGRLAGVLCQVDRRLAGREEDVEAFLRRYCWSKFGGLVMGGPASPDLFNIYCGTLIDAELHGLCQRYGLTYTRYLDDLTFSSAKAPIGTRKRRAIREVIFRAGFTVSDRKAGVYDLCRKAIVVNGVGLAWRGRLFMSRHYLVKLRGLIHLAITGGAVSPNRITGMMSAFKAIRRGGPFTRTEERLLDDYRRFRRLTQTRAR